MVRILALAIRRPAGDPLGALVLCGCRGRGPAHGLLRDAQRRDPEVRS